MAHLLDDGRAPDARRVPFGLVLSFFLAFTDFGIPVSIAGQYNVIATELYQTMMGAIPNFGAGAVIAISMLVPSAAAVWALKRADRLNFRYNQISEAAPMQNRLRDGLFLLTLRRWASYFSRSSP